MEPYLSSKIVAEHQRSALEASRRERLASDHLSSVRIARAIATWLKQRPPAPVGPAPKMGFEAGER